MSGWIYYGTLPSVEDRSRYAAPPDYKSTVQDPEYDGDEIEEDEEE